MRVKSINNFREKLEKIHYLKKNNRLINKNYYKWIKKNEPNKNGLEEQKCSNKFFKNPKISIVIPTYNPNIRYFKMLIDSLINQTYSNIEICIADGSTEKNEALTDILIDSRIKYSLLKQNGGISENTNQALKMVTGEYIAFVDHDDILPLFSIYEIVKCINKNNDAEFIYTDHDIIIENKRCNAFFKPDFSIDLLRSYNYICHMVVVKKSLLDKVGMLNKEFDGAQDYDFVLRCTENTDKIVHIPKVLYSWRSSKNSTSRNSKSKSYAYDAGKKAIEEHLKREKIKAEVFLLKEKGRYRVKYELTQKPLVSIIIPNKDSKQDLEKCINSIKKSTYDNYEIIIIENNSKSDEIFEYYNYLKDDKKIKIVEYKTNVFNFSKINNFGVKSASGKYLLFLNNDTEVIEYNWIEEMLSFIQRKDVGIVGAKLLYFDSTVQHAGVIIGMGGVAGHINKNIADKDPGYYSRASVVNNFSAVTAACLMTKKDIFEEVEGFEEEGLAVAFNDVDYCMKVITKGYLCVYTPFAKLFHYESKSRGLENTREKKERFYKEICFFKDKWKDYLMKGDPYFNPNLRLDTSKFMVEYKKKIYD